MDSFLSDNFEHKCFSDFFKNKELDTKNIYESDVSMACNFSHLIEREDMPQFGKDGKEYLV
jgi:hypothetical protein